ncbi:MAG: hypothetical protein ACXAEU_03215 [Candidatus Hodarchaeales archaeon]|jgi:hypothetical protein
MNFGKQKMICHYCKKKVRRIDYRKHINQEHPKVAWGISYIIKGRIYSGTKGNEKKKPGEFWSSNHNKEKSFSRITLPRKTFSRKTFSKTVLEINILGYNITIKKNIIKAS